jgi:hypothetical protein
MARTTRNTTHQPAAPAATLGAALAQPAAPAPAPAAAAPALYVQGAKAPRPRTTLAPGQKSQTVHAWEIVAAQLSAGPQPLADLGAAVVAQLGAAAAPKKYAPYFVRRGWLVPLGS